MLRLGDELLGSQMSRSVFKRYTFFGRMYLVGWSKVPPFSSQIQNASLPAEQFAEISYKEVNVIMM